MRQPLPHGRGSDLIRNPNQSRREGAVADMPLFSRSS
jgi:hypothetical protein